MAAPEDPHLPRRLRAVAAFRRGEERVGRAWFRSMTRWLDRIRPSVMLPTRAGNPPDPSGTGADPGLWQRLMDSEVVPEIKRLFDGTYRAVAPERDSDADPYAVDYLAGARNRLTGIPDEVYALITAQIERGLREGLGIPEIGALVEQTLTATGSDRWRNRAITVARTETIGASNAGAFAGAVRRALDEGDSSATKVWVSTMDTRTREDHVFADQQQVALLQPFMVGGAALMFPGDPSGPADQVINCRCTLIESVGGVELDWTNRQFLGGDE